MYFKTTKLYKIFSIIVCFSFVLTFETPSFSATADVKAQSTHGQKSNMGDGWESWKASSKDFGTDAAKIMAAQLLTQASLKGLEKVGDGLSWAGGKIGSTFCSTTEWCGEERFKGFKPLDEAIKSLEEIRDGVSTRKIYGQTDAKSQFIPIMLKSLEKIDEAKNNAPGRDKKGNAIYIVGSPGTGKTELVKATAEAVLKHPEKTFLTIDPSMINDKSSLDDQLFKTLYQEENIQKDKTGSNSNIYDAKGRSRILSTLQDYDGETIIFIDDYEKMKEKSSPNARTTNKYHICDEEACELVEGPSQDRTADETLKQIAANGGYWIGKTWVPCDKAIIFVATNENIEDLENNFGFGGEKGGGLQRLGGSNSIIQFKNLDFETCRKIVMDTINKLREKFTDPRGRYKFASFLVNEKTIDALAALMEVDKKVQGRLKDPIETAISSLFADCISGKGMGKTFELFYERKDGTDPLHTSNFRRREISRSIYNIPSFHHEGDATIPYEGKDIPVVTDVPICETCKSFLIYFPNLKGKNISWFWTSPAKLKEGMDNFFLKFSSQLPSELRGETVRKMHQLLNKEIDAQNYVNKNCLLITVNTKGTHQNYVTLRYARKEVLKKPDGDVYYVNYQP